MRYAVTAATAALLLPLAACSMSWDSDKEGPGIAGTGSGTSRSYAVADFSGIDLRGADDVDVRVGTGFSVRAEGPSEELDRLRIGREGDTLDIGRRKGTSWGHHDKVKVFVTLPRLAEASVSGSGTMTVDRVEGARFEANLAGSGDLDLTALAVDKAEVSIAGSGNVAAKGAAKALEVSIAGSGDLDAAGLATGSAKVSIAGSGGVRAAVNGPAKVDIMGSGDVDLGPQARCTTSKMGSGSVRCG